MKNGEFPGERVELPRKKRNLIITISWNIVLALPMLYAVYSLVCSSLLVSVPTVAGVILIGKLKLVVPMDNLHVRLSFNLSKANKIFYNS